MKFLLSISLFLTCTVVVRGQNNFGSLHSNYTPTNSLYINPTSILDAKVWLDINLVGIGSYTNNNFVYLEDRKWTSVTNDIINENTSNLENDVRYNQGKNKYHMYNRNFVAGLAVVWSQGNHAAALSTGGRSFTAVRNIPEYAGYFIENGVTNYTVQHDIDYELNNLRVGSMHFGEIKGTYAYTFFKRREEMFIGGLSISKFLPVGGAGLNVYDARFQIDNDSLAVLYNVEMDAMYTPDPGFNLNGGWGLDLGFTYQKMKDYCSSYYPNSKKGGCNSIPYKYKIGVSLMDLGYVKFPQEDVLFSGYDFDNYDWYNYDTEEVSDANGTEIWEEVEPDIESGQVRKPYKMSLPTFFSVQYDHNVWASRIYVNATWVQGIPPGKRKFGVRHANSLSVTPRYESFWFDFAIPISLYEYRYPQLGASVRLGPLTVGTDKLISWIKDSNLYGADIYAHLKIPIRYNPKCGSRIRASKKSGKNRSMTRCTI